MGFVAVTKEFLDKPFPAEADLATTFIVSRTVTREAVEMQTAKDC
ncbi:hypothetical protein [Sphingomonas oryzagri]|nr:hypothetical protein [Sphingomonas oryzagri]